MSLSSNNIDLSKFTEVNSILEFFQLFENLKTDGEYLFVDVKKPKYFLHFTGFEIADVHITYDDAEEDPDRPSFYQETYITQKSMRNIIKKWLPIALSIRVTLENQEVLSDSVFKTNILGEDECQKEKKKGEAYTTYIELEPNLQRFSYFADNELFGREMKFYYLK